MPPIRRQLNESKRTTLSFFGSGQVEIGPSFYGESWEVRIAAVMVSPATAIPTARIYLGAPTPGNLLAATYDGSGDSTDLSVTLSAGQRLTCTWGAFPDATGDPGATATLSVSGTQIIGEP